MHDFGTWMTADWRSSVNVVITTLLMFTLVTVCIRVAGLRSLSKMSSTDFIFTVATGSLLASIISAPKPSFVIGAVAIVSVFALRSAIAWLRRHTNAASEILDNHPVFLMKGQNIITENLDAHSVSIGELHGKLREANVWSYSQVVNVVLETTGDISVIHRTKEEAEVDDVIFKDVDQ